MARRTPSPRRPANVLPFPAAAVQAQPQQRQHWQDTSGAADPGVKTEGPAPRRREPPAVVYSEEERIRRFIRPTTMLWYPQLQQGRERE